METIVPYANLHSDCPMGHNMRNGMNTFDQVYFRFLFRYSGNGILFVYPLYMCIRYRVIRCHVISINSWSCNLKGNEVYNVHYHRRSPYPCPTVKGKRTVRFVTKSNASGDDKRGNVTDGISSGD